MKKLLFTGLALFVAAASYAQFNQGTMLIGGEASIDFGNRKAKDNTASATLGKYSAFSVNPKVGYFIIDNLAAGAGLEFASGSFEQDGSGDKFASSSFGFVPFVRYYLPAKLYGQFEIGIGSEKDKDTIGGTTTETKYGTMQWSLAAGYALFLNESVAIEPQIGYGSSSSKAKDNNPTDFKNIDAGIFINVGIQVYLAK